MSEKYNLAVYIGRFQPVTKAHIECIRRAYEVADHVLVIIGSAFEAPTIKNPFSYEERRQMIINSSPPGVLVDPAVNSLYNNNEWAEQIQDIVGQYTRNNKDTCLIGHKKDDSSFYLDMFPQWEYVEVGEIDNGVSATSFRDNFFTNGSIANAPVKIVPFLTAFKNTSEYERLCEEYRFIQTYKAAWANAPYPPTFVTVDAVVIQSGHVLMVQRKAAPGRGLWALPGGFLNQRELLVDAMIRELREETGLKVPGPVLRGSIKDSRVFDAPDRSLRGRTITHAYFIELPHGTLPKVKGGDDAAKAKWIQLWNLNEMSEQFFEDHLSIVKAFV